MKRIIILSLVVALLIVGAGAALAQEAECEPGAAFVADVSVPDNTVFEPGESFEKVWRLENTGDCEWNENYALAFVDGDQLDEDGLGLQLLGVTVAPGETVDIAVKMIAPEEDGVYTSYWQMANDEDALFGDEFYVKIVVGTPPEGETPAPAGETPPPVSAPIPGIGEVITLDDGTLVYGFIYTASSSSGSPEFQEQKSQAISAGAREFVTLEPRPALMIVIPLDEAGTAIAADRVFIRGDDVAALNIDASIIMAPETGKAVLLLENWIGEISQVDVGDQSVEVPAKQGEEPGRAFVSLEPGHYVVKGRIRGAEGQIEIDLEAGWFFVWALAVAGY